MHTADNNSAQAITSNYMWFSNQNLLYHGKPNLPIRYVFSKKSGAQATLY